MGSYIQIDSISIDLDNAIDKRDAGKCEHFSIRGYVSEVRKKDWKICWPFSIHESDKQPSLPPLDVPNYRCGHCQNSQQEIAAQDIHKDDQTDFNHCNTVLRSDINCSNAALESGMRQDPMPDTLERRDIDLNTNLSCVNDCLPISNDKGKKAAVVHSETTDHEISLEDTINHKVTSVPSPKNCADLAQGVHATKRDCEGNEVSHVELASNLNCIGKNSADTSKGGTPADNQCQMDLIKGSTNLGAGTTVMEAGPVYDHTTGPPLESVTCNQSVPARSMDNAVENDFRDHHLGKSTGLSRRKPRKVRLMTDLLSENGELKTAQITRQESVSHGTSDVSAASQAPPIIPGKADIQGNLTLTNTVQSKKRKFPLDEVQRPASLGFQRVQIEVHNLERNGKTTDTALDIRSNSKAVPAGTGFLETVKGHLSKPETEKGHTMSKKKNKKIHVVDGCLIPKPQQGQLREKEDTRDSAATAHASKTLSSRFSPGTFTGKRMDNFPFHSLRNENEFNLSKEKGKMLQTVGELDSLSHQKNDMLVVQNSFAYSGEKTRSGMPVTVPIASAQGILNGKGSEERLQLSLNSYLPAQVYNQKCIHQIENRLPFSFHSQEGTSKVPQFKRKDSETNVIGGPGIPSKHTTNAISGKGVHCKEINGGRNPEKSTEAVGQLGIMKRCSEQTVEVSEQGTVDDIPMEIVELMAKNQYERCLPDVDNRSSMLEKSTIRRKPQMMGGSAAYGKGEMSLLKEGQKERPRGRPRKNNTVTRGESAKPNKTKPVHYFSPFDGNNLGLNNLCAPQQPFGFEVSQSQKKSSTGFQFSPMGSNQLGGARNFGFNGSLEERGYSNATSLAQGGCSLHKNILQQNNEASRIWASLKPNHVSLGYDIPKKVVSQPTSSNLDITSLRSGGLHNKQNMKRDIDLNYINLSAAGPEKLSRSTGPVTFSRMNGDCSFPCKHNGLEPHQNLRGSLDLYSNETIPAMHLLSLMDAGMQSRTPYNVGATASGPMLKRPSYPGDCNTKLEIGTSKVHSTLKRPSSDFYSRSYLSDKPHGCFVGSPTFGASASTQQHDMKFMRTAGFSGQNPTKSGKKEKMNSSNSTLQNRVNKQLSWPAPETEPALQRKLEVNGTHQTSAPFKVVSGNTCMVNRNPADFTMPEAGNIYMIRGEDLKFEKSISRGRPRINTPYGYKQQKNLKGTKTKEHSKP